MSERFEELMCELERLTASILKLSNPEHGSELAKLNEGVANRAALVRELSEHLKCLPNGGSAGDQPPLTYADYNRLAIEHFQGERIRVNLDKLRTGIAAELRCGQRDRLYTDRIADQLASVTPPGGV